MIGHDGASLIGHDGASLVGAAKGGLLLTASGGVVVKNAGQVVSDHGLGLSATLNSQAATFTKGGNLVSNNAGK